MSSSFALIYKTIKIHNIERNYMIGRQEQPKLEKGDIIDYDNRRWHVDSVYSDGSIQLTNLNPLDGTINMSP